jgi:hypothetical protein
MQPAQERAENAQPEQQQQQSDGVGQQQQAEAPDSTPGQGADLQECRQTLADVCNQPDCWGLLGLDLMTGEAALHEENVCRLHIDPGKGLRHLPVMSGSAGQLTGYAILQHVHVSGLYTCGCCPTSCRL